MLFSTGEVIIMRASVLALAVASAAWAQSPRINYRGVVNAASFMPPGLPGRSIARESIFSVFGAGIGPVASPSLSFPLQTTLGGVSMRLTQGSTAVQAIPVFVGPGQINAIAPPNTPLGLVSLQLSFNNLKTASVPVVVGGKGAGRRRPTIRKGGLAQPRAPQDDGLAGLSC